MEGCSMDSVEELKKKVRENTDAVRGKIVEIAAYIFDNPEIGYEEHKACALLTSELGKHGFEVTKGVAGLPTAGRLRRGWRDRPRLIVLAGILGALGAAPRAAGLAGRHRSEPADDPHRPRRSRAG